MKKGGDEMSEGYFNLVDIDEARRAFALECIIKTIGEKGSGSAFMEGTRWAGERITKRAKVFEDYLKG